MSRHYEELVRTKTALGRWGDSDEIDNSIIERRLLKSSIHAYRVIRMFGNAVLYFICFVIGGRAGEAGSLTAVLQCLFLLGIVLATSVWFSQMMERNRFAIPALYIFIRNTLHQRGILTAPWWKYRDDVNGTSPQ